MPRDFNVYTLNIPKNSIPKERRRARQRMISQNAELIVARAAMGVAIDLNSRYGDDVVEVVRGPLNKGDGGVDVSVRYATSIWKTPGKFLQDFFPALQIEMEKER